MERSSGLLQQELEILSGKRLEMKINRNRVSLLRKTEMGQKMVKLSIHEAFLSAPLEVVEAVGDWIGGRESEAGEVALRHFINGIELKRPAPEKLQTEGEVYDLKEIYQKLNGHYFGGELDLKYTWYQPKNQRRRCRSMTLGTYCDDRELVRINTILDNRKVIPEFVEFVVYHEMVHHVVPATRDRAGRRIVHNRRFREVERQFEHYDLAIEWERKNGWTQ
jgi:hypothetical protein